MRNSYSLLVYLLVGLGFAAFGNVGNAENPDKYENTLSSLSNSFRKNMGQWDKEIIYAGYFQGNHVNFLKDGVSFGAARESELSTGKNGIEKLIWNMVLDGANVNADFSSRGESASNVHYFYGNDPAKFIRNTPVAKELVYGDIYKKIDLHFYTNEEGQLKYDYVVQPGGELSTIKMRYDGVSQLDINRKGELEVSTPWGIVIEDKPYSYQVINGVKKELDIRYELIDKTSFGFKVYGDYDPSYEVIVDPIILGWSTFIGRQKTSVGPHAYIYDIAVDNKGYVYGTGRYPREWPTTPGVVQPTEAGDNDVFVFRMNPDGASLVYATYLGGSKNDIGNGIVVDDKGNAYIAGRAGKGFPTTAGSFRPNFNGGLWDAFLTKLNPLGTQLIYSTFIGGSDNEMVGGLVGTGMGASGMDCGIDVAINKNGEAFVAGYTPSTNFPTTAGAFQTTMKGRLDAFIIKINAAGSGAMRSTYFGGAGDDRAYGIEVNGAGEVFVAGGTTSVAGDFPTTAGAYNTSMTGTGGKVFVAKFNANLMPVYSTFVGDGFATDIDIDPQGNAYICGGMPSSFNGPSYPVTAGVFQSKYAGGGGFGGSGDIRIGESFVTKLNANGSGLVYSTFLGGSADDHARGIRVTDGGEAFVTGTTWSSDFPVTGCGLYSTNNGKTEGFICKINADASNLDFSTYWGGSMDDYWASIDIREGRGCVSAVYTARTSHSLNLTVTSGAYQTLHGNGGADQVSVMKLEPEINIDFNFTINGTGCSTPVQFTGQANGNCIWKQGPWTPSSWYWDFGDGSTATTKSPSHIFANPGTYNVKLVVGCPADSVMKTVTIQSPFSGFDLGPDKNFCNGETINEVLNAGSYPNATYKWQDNSSGQSFTATKVGTYYVTVTSEGCSATDTIKITKATIGGSVEEKDVTCPGGNDGSIKALPTGGTEPYTYSWSNGQKTQTATGLKAGQHQVTVTDANGCTISADLSITEPPAIAVTSTKTDAKCSLSGGSATVSVTGGTPGYTYSWTPSGGTAATANDLAPGTYTVTITDANNCIKTEQVTINSVPENITGSVANKQNADCSGQGGSATVAASGGTSPYNYSWNNGNTGASASNLNAGTYTVSITDINGCTGSVQVVIESSGDLTAQVGSPTVHGCDRQGAVNADATVTVTGGTGPYTYLWDDSRAQTTATATGLPTGTYTVKVTDQSGCSGSATVTIDDILQLDGIVVKEPGCSNCADGEATVQVTGGTSPYTYRWNDLNQQTTATAVGLPPGIYVVTVTDDKDCRNTDTVNVGNVAIGIDDAGNLDQLISVYPNPNNGKFYIDIDTPGMEKVYVKIYDLTGKEVYNTFVSNGLTTISSDRITKGIYFVELIAEQVRVTKRIQVIR